MYACACCGILATCFELREGLFSGLVSIDLPCFLEHRFLRDLFLMRACVVDYFSTSF